MWLRILSGERKGQWIPLGSAHLKIGRDKENDLILPDSQVSPLHAHLFSNQNGQWFMKNVTPGKPLYVDETEHRNTFSLQPGMVIQIGKTLVQFEVSRNPTHQAYNTYNNRTQQSSIVQPSASSRVLPVLLGAGVGILILGFVLLLATNNIFGPSEAQIAATQTEIALANATATPTVTQTATPTATATVTVTPSPTQTPAPTATATPLLEPVLGTIEEDIYTPQSLDPSLLQNVAWQLDVLLTVPIQFTNYTTEPIAYTDIQVGLFAQPVDELIQVPSFFLENNDEANTIPPNETRILRWQIVLPRDVQLHAWKVIYKDIQVQKFLRP